MEALSSQQLIKEAQIEYEKGEYRSAAGLFKAAADGFLSAGDELNAAEQANNSSVAYLKAGDGEHALKYAQGTDKIFAARGDVKRQAMALGNQAAALEMLNSLDEAITTYEKSSELLKQVGEHELRAYVCQSISTLLLRRRRYLEAYATMRAGVMGIKKPSPRQRLLKTLMDIPFKLIK